MCRLVPHQAAGDSKSIPLISAKLRENGALVAEPAVKGRGRPNPDGSTPEGFSISGGGWTPGDSRGLCSVSGNRRRCGRAGPAGWTRGPGGPGGLAARPGGPVLLEGKLALKVPGVAAEGRRGEAVAGGQGAEAHPMDEGAVDVGAGGMVANGTTFVHIRCSFRFSVCGFR